MNSNRLEERIPHSPKGPISLSVLYAEDDENDVTLMQIGFKTAGLLNSLKIARNGQEAIDYLAGTGCYANRIEYPLPCLVLLDLGMPVCDGFQVLMWIREQLRFRNLPVVVFTASDNEACKDKSVIFGATEYITKPRNPTGLDGLLREMSRRWLISGSPMPVAGDGEKASLSGIGAESQAQGPAEPLRRRIS